MSQLVTFVRQGEKTIPVLGGGGRNERKQRADSEGTSSSFSDFWVSFVIPCTCTDTKRLTKACKEFVIVHTWPMKGTKNFSQLKSKNIESFVRLKEHLNFFADVFLYSMFVFLYYFPLPSSSSSSSYVVVCSHWADLFDVSCSTVVFGLGRRALSAFYPTLAQAGSLQVFVPFRFRLVLPSDCIERTTLNRIWLPWDGILCHVTRAA